MLLLKAIDAAYDRFKKIRVGQITSDINDNGEIDVSWLDGEAGGQGRVLISYPAFNNVDADPWGMELGYSRGMIGIFGFLTDNHAVLLGTIVSKIKDKGVGYDKTQQIKSGEFRIKSKGGAEIYWDLIGNLTLKTTNTKFYLNNTDKTVEITAPNGLFLNGNPVT